MVKFWSSFSAHTNKPPKFVTAFVKIMPLLQTSKGALDPSYFLKCLKQIISKAGSPAFDLFSQQDATEILSYILGELCRECIHASESVRIHIRQTISCTACQQYTSTENSSSILQLPVSESIQKSLNSYLESNFLSGENEFFCNTSSSNNQALADHEISKVGDYLIIQVKRFLVFNQAVTKDITKISCTLTLTVPVTLDEDVVGHKKFNVIATINHTGNLARGHYTSFIKSTSSTVSL